MRPQDLLRDLRDIHLPPDGPAGPDAGFALWPILLLALLLGALLALRLWHRGAWRRAARARFAAIDSLGDWTRQWALLLELAVEIARRSGGSAALPEVAYRDPGSLGQAEVERLRHHVGTELGR